MHILDIQRNLTETCRGEENTKFQTELSLKYWQILPYN